VEGGVLVPVLPDAQHQNPYRCSAGDKQLNQCATITYFVNAALASLLAASISRIFSLCLDPFAVGYVVDIIIIRGKKE